MKLSNVTLCLMGAALLVACTATPRTTPALEQARAAIARVEAQPRSVSAAGAELDAAREALAAAEAAADARRPADEIDHLAYLAERKANVVEARVRERTAAEVVEQGEAKRNAALLEARERDAAMAEQRAREAEAQAERARQQLAEAQQTERGMVLTLSDVLFDTGRADLKPGTQLALDRTAEFLRRTEGMRVIVEGHTDSQGPDEYNRELSQRRAEAVASALRSRGITGDRIEILGLGEGYPIAGNDSAAGRQQNRRVEIIFSDDRGTFNAAARRRVDSTNP
jgi:outer membrane protein OmpA-like peptidoglycan-associated protein